MEDLEYTQRHPTLGVGETILWRGKPKRSAFILKKSLTLMPIAVVWLCLDATLLMTAFRSDSPWFVIPFMLLHLMPVWMWLGSMLTASRRWKNTQYYVTNRRIIIQSGFLAVNETTLFYKDLRNARVHIGLMGKLTKSGDILFDVGGYYGNQRGRGQLPSMEALEDPYPIYERVQKTVMDVQTDMEYPNAFRPAENPGYRTDYQN